MAETITPISSAVILPDTDPSPSESTPPKRRRSSTSESAVKRPRLSEDVRSQSPDLQDGASKSPTIPPAEALSQHNQERRKASIQEERKRGQRLFGGLLSTLSQTAPNNQNKRRQEIEKRQQERAKQQKAADDGRRAEKMANLKAVRQAEQIKFDEQSMKIRHSNMLAMANFLSTTAEPKLYYKPWELLPAEESRIKQQLVDTQVLVTEELTDFNERHPKAVSGSTEKTNRTSSLETVGEPDAASSSIPIDSNVSSSTVVDTTNPPVLLQAAVRSDQVTTNAQEEHNGEVVVENDEDTVIY